jgi:hypothetical protein
LTGSSPTPNTIGIVDVQLLLRARLESCSARQLDTNRGFAHRGAASVTVPAEMIQEEMKQLQAMLDARQNRNSRVIQFLAL